MTNCLTIDFKIVLIKQELEPLSVMMLPPKKDVLHCAFPLNVGKPSYEYPLTVGFTSKHKLIAGMTFFFRGNISRLVLKYESGPRTSFLFFMNFSMYAEGVAHSFTIPGI